MIRVIALLATASLVSCLGVIDEEEAHTLRRNFALLEKEVESDELQKIRELLATDYDILQGGKV